MIRVIRGTAAAAVGIGIGIGIGIGTGTATGTAMVAPRGSVRARIRARIRVRIKAKAGIATREIAIGVVVAVVAVRSDDVAAAVAVAAGVTVTGRARTAAVAARPVRETEAVAAGVDAYQVNDGDAPARARARAQTRVPGRAGATGAPETLPPATVEPLRIAFVVQRYGEDVNGGAEYHCRLVAEHLAPMHHVEVLTTCARDYITWANERKPGPDRVLGVPVRRFKVKRPRDPDRFGRISQKVFLGRHTDEQEHEWLEEQGPFSPALLRYVKRHADDYDYFVFFSYRYYHSYYGVRSLPEKAVLVPTAEKDEVIELRIFRELFRLPRAIVYNSVEEREMIWRAADNRRVFGDVVGVGSRVPDRADEAAFRAAHDIRGAYAIYIGRVDPNKGCRTLFHYFRRFREETESSLTLVLIGGLQMELPEDPAVRYLGFLPEDQKWGALQGADLLIMPSELESLSMVTLEAWALSKPVLVNGKCDVLRGQCRRANGGLYFDDYYEFREALAMLSESSELREKLGSSGRRYFEEHYRWEVVVGKYNRIFERLRRDDERRGASGAGAGSRRSFLRRIFG